MDFSIPEPVRERLDAARVLLERDVLPFEPLLARPFAEVAPALEPARARARELGLWAPQMPPEHGGAGLSFLELALLGAELGRSPLGHYAVNAQAPDAGNMELLRHHGTEDQKRRFLDPLVRSEVRSAFAMTEPDRPGSNPTWLDTSARREDDAYVIDGRKWFTSGADGAAFVIVMAVTDPGAPPHRRASLLIVPADAPGFRLVRNIPVMGHAGSGWASHAELAFAGCRIPVENRIGEEGEGFALAQARLGPGRVHHCMRWIGIAERAFDLMCRRAVLRELRPGEPLADRQIVRGWVAEGRAAIDAARLSVLHAAWTIDRLGAPAAREAISLIKFSVARVMLDVLDRAIQAHGAAGLTDDCVLSWFYRHERAARIYDGPDEVHQDAVARRVLQRYGGMRD